MALTDILKKIPIDFGQASLKHSTHGKKIALDLVGEARGGMTLLDIGCRDGYFSRLFEARGFRVTSGDIECHYEKCVPLDANAPLPFPDNSFDRIWCSEVIEHVIDPQFTLSEFRRVLKSGGRAVLTTPNSTFWLYGILRLFGKTPRDVQNLDHKHFFGEKDIIDLSPDGTVYGYFPYMLFKRRIKRLVGFLSPTFIFTITK